MSGDVAEIAQISFYLAKSDQTVDTVLSGEKDLGACKGLREHSFSVDDAQIKFFYFESQNRKKNPKWLDFINEKIPEDEQITFVANTCNPNGLLLILVEGKVFAATFGRSAPSYLNDEAFETDFGIKTAMNMCGNEEIKQTRSQSNTVTLTQIDRQVGKPSDSFVFGLSEVEDLRYISAHVKGDEKVTLQGRSNLTVKFSGGNKLKWDEIIDRCKVFYDAFNKEDYQTLFPNYRNLRQATKAETDALNEQLIETLQSEDFEKIQLGIPEFVAEDSFSFSYSDHARKENTIYSYLDAVQLRKSFDITKINLKKLISSKIYLYSHGEDRVLSYRSWKLFNCIVFETKLDESYFVLSDGRWLEVETDFYNSIVEFAANTLCVEPCEENFKNIDISDKVRQQNREEIFNQKVCELRPEAILFDQAKLKLGAGHSNKEFCDILDLKDDGNMRIVHCKKYKDNAAASTLFSQAHLYSAAFVQDETFLREIRKFIQVSDHPHQANYLDYIESEIAEHNASKYEVCLWFLHDRLKAAPEPVEMPIMALYQLKLMHDQLRNGLKFKQLILRFIPVHKVNFEKKKKPKA
jgi:uncharacterized protein (TIGR04141 family)